MRLGRRGRLAAAACAGGVLAAAAGCSGSPGNGDGHGRHIVRSGTVGPHAEPGSCGRDPPRRGLAHLRARLRPQRRGRRGGHGGRFRFAAGRLASAPGRRGLRAAAAGRRHGHRGHRKRLALRARPGDRQGPVADARRHPGAAVRAAVRQHRPARHHRHAGLRPVQRDRLRRGGDLGLPPRAGRDLGHRRPPAGGARHPRSGRAAAVRPAAARADAPGRPGLRGVRRAGRGLRAVPGLRRGRPGQRQRADHLLRGADPARRGHLGPRRPGHRPGRHPVRQRGQRLGGQHQLRRQRLGDRPVP